MQPVKCVMCGTGKRAVEMIQDNNRPEDFYCDEECRAEFLDEPCCPNCNEPYDDDDHQMSYDDSDAPCLSCMQAKADLRHDMESER